jgi:hypothetical protein
MSNIIQLFIDPKLINLTRFENVLYDHITTGMDLIFAERIIRDFTSQYALHLKYGTRELNPLSCLIICTLCDTLAFPSNYCNVWPPELDNVEYDVITPSRIPYQMLNNTYDMWISDPEIFYYIIARVYCSDDSCVIIESNNIQKLVYDYKEKEIKEFLKHNSLTNDQ